MLRNPRFSVVAGLFAAAAAGALLSACNGNGVSSVPSQIAAPTAIAAPQSATPAATGKNLYVGGSGSVTVYAPGSVTPLRTITQGIFNASALAFDASGNLYVVNCHLICKGKGTVTVYAAGTNTLLRTITEGMRYPTGIAVDESGKLWVANEYSVNVYARRSSKPLRTINNGVARPVALALTSLGKLYVANNLGDTDSNFTVYAPGAGQPMRTVSKGVYSPATMLLSGKLYIGNGNPISTPGKCCSVAVYGLGGDLKMSITQGVKYPRALALDGSGNLYVANCATCAGVGSPQDSVTVYAAGKDTVLRTISKDVGAPSALAFDGSGNLYVANGNANGNNPFSVTVYPKGKSTNPIRTIETKYSPLALAFGP
jgi:sugar lactone lactonase YvrE